MNFDWRDGLDVNGGGYWSVEYGGNLSRPNFSVDIGVESLLFTSPYFDGALSGLINLVLGHIINIRFLILEQTMEI